MGRFVDKNSMRIESTVGTDISPQRPPDRTEDRPWDQLVVPETRSGSESLYSDSMKSQYADGE
jgi:hypothetical protein